MMHKLRGLDPDAVATSAFGLNSFSDAASMQAQLEAPLEKKSGLRYGAPGSRRLVYFIDDLNMPAVDKYGTQSAVELARQLVSEGGEGCCCCCCCCLVARMRGGGARSSERERGHVGGGAAAAQHAPPKNPQQTPKTKANTNTHAPPHTHAHTKQTKGRLPRLVRQGQGRAQGGGGRAGVCVCGRFFGGGRGC